MARFVNGGRSTVVDAQRQAQCLGAPTVEAEHLLLALSEREDAAGRALRSLGLDRPAARSAIDQEWRDALERIGLHVETAVLGDGPPSPLPPDWGASAKATLEQAPREARDRRDRHIGSEHILLALLRFRRGGVVRVLHAAGLRPEDIEAELARELGRTM